MPGAMNAMPKVELHVHLDGSFDAELLYETAKKRLAKGELPDEVASPLADCPDLAAFEALVTCLPTELSLKAMLDRFMFFLPIIQGQFDVIEEMAFKFVEMQAAQNVVYCEVRYSPQILTNAGAFIGADAKALSERCDVAKDSKRVVECVTAGLRRGCAAHPSVQVNQILCFIDGRPEWAASLIELAAADKAAGPGRTCAVVAVDIAAGEAHFQDAQGEAVPAAAEAAAADGAVVAAGTESGNGRAHRAACRRCAALGFPITVHAGESGPAANVAASTSAAYGGAARIGHGYAAVDVTCEECAPSDHAAAATAMKALGLAPNVTFECCPTSSRATGGWAAADWTLHPVVKLARWRAAALAAGDAESAAQLPRVTISSDDPSVFGKSLTDEISLGSQEMGLELEELRVCTCNAIDGAFIDADARRELRERFDVAWGEWSGS